MNKKPVILIILDGWGYRKEKKYNAIAASDKPNFDRLWSSYPHAVLQASGEAIGLPKGQIGTSEANHLTIGSGRILYQNLLRINNEIKNDTLKTNLAIQEAFDHVKKYNSVLHIKGIVGPGGVHGHSEHLKALVYAAKNSGIKHVMLHLFTDGRDTPPKSAIEYVQDLQRYLNTQGVGKIASIGGRYYGMDRDNNLDRTRKHFLLMAVGEGPRFRNPIDVIKSSYKKGITDEFIEPALIETEKGEVGCVQTNDAVIFANFRADRAKQLTRLFVEKKIPNLKYVTMTQYADDIDVRVAFPPEKITNTLSDVISKHGLKQLRITETEKFTHLTFFFNAQKDKADLLEDRTMIASNKDVKTHDQKPEMKVFEIAKHIVQDLDDKSHDFICTNLVNADIVGHTGNFEAIKKAIHSIDSALGRIMEAAKRNDAAVIITADHGNAEETFDESINQAITAHTLNPVPFILCSKEYRAINRNEGLLSDIAPTILNLFHLPVPKEMTGSSFI